MTESVPIAPGTMPGRQIVFWVLGVILLSTGAAYFNDYAGAVLLGGGFAYLCHRTRDSSADLFGLILVAFCACPFLRRIHDFHLGYNPFSALLLSPYACFVPLFQGALRKARRVRSRDLIPFVLLLLALFWSFIVGSWELGFVSSMVGAVEWCSGPFLFLYLVLQGGRLDYQRFGVWLSWIMVIEGVYGLYQWVQPPLYDTKWLMDSGMNSSMGEPLPFRMRTFGTLNSTGVLAFICAVYLIMGMGWKKYVPVALLALAVLVTTLVRAAWIITGVGMGLVVVLQGGRERFKVAMKLGIIAGILAVAGAPLLAKFSDIQKRIDSMRKVSNDGSYKDRHALMEAAMTALMETPLGAGIGSVGRGARLTKNGIGGIDNGFIAMTYVLGWVGSAVYLGVFLLLTLQVLARGDPNSLERASIGALSLAMMASNVFGTSFVDLGGILCWSALAMGFLSRRSFLQEQSMEMETRSLPLQDWAPEPDPAEPRPIMPPDGA